MGFFQVLQSLSWECPVDWWYPYNISVNAWSMKNSSWSLKHWDTAMTGMKVIFHLGNIIQLISGCIPATLCFLYIYLQSALRVSRSVIFTMLLKAIGVTGMHLTLLSITLSSWSKPEYIKCWIILMNIFLRGSL